MPDTSALLATIFSGLRQTLSVMTLALCACQDPSEPASVSSDSTPAPADIPRVVTSNVEPWGFADDDGKPQGMLVDFQRSLFTRAGLHYENQLQPYPRVIHAIASGTADVAVMFKSPGADEVAVSLGQVLSAPIIIVVPAEDETRYTTLDDFRGKVVGHVRGSSYGPAFDNHTAFKHVSVPHVDQGLRMLKAGRLDAMASTKHSLLYAMYETGIAGDQLRVALPMFNASADLYVSRRAANAPWVGALRNALDAMRKDGSLTPSFYQSPYWPYLSLCFKDGQCIATQ